MSMDAPSFMLGVPRVPSGALVRERLLERIGRAPVTVLRAPGGSGKTVVMAQWAEQQAVPGVWLTVEPDTGGRLAFWNSVAARLAASGKAFPGAELSTVRQQAAGHDAITSMVVRAFLAGAEPLVLIIDDAQNLTDARIADDLLAVVAACRTVHVVLATRSTSRFEEPDVALSIDTEIIGPEDVALSVAEVGEVIDADAGSSLTAYELHAVTGGNALLTRAVLHGGGIGPGDSPQDRSHAAIRGHWRTLTRADRELGQFGLDTAIPDDFDMHLARQLSGLQDVERYVGTLEYEGLVLRTDGPDASRFRFHPLVREVLRTESRRRSKSEFRRLSVIASLGAAGRGHHVAALRHAVEAEDFELVTSVLLSGGMPMIRGGEAAAILRGTALRHAAQYPLIAFVLALSANARGQRWRALELFALALAAGRTTRLRQSPSERIVLDVVESSVLRVTGRASESVVPARRALNLIERATDSELRQIAPHVNVMRVHCAIAFFRGGAIAEAANVLERLSAAEGADGTAAESTERLSALSLTAAVNAIQGRMAEVDQTLREIDRSGLPSEVLDSYSGSLAHLARAIGGAEEGDMARVRTHIAVLAAHMPTLEYRLMFSALHALSCLWEGEAAVALQALSEDQRRDAPRGGVSRSDERLLTATRALLKTAMGETGAAEDEVRRLPPGDGIRLLLDAHLMLIGRRPELAFPRLMRIQPGEHDARMRAARDILLVCSALQSGDRDATATALNRYASNAIANGLTSPLLLVPAELRAELLAFGDSLGGAAAKSLVHLAGFPKIFRLSRMRVSLTPREREILHAFGTDLTHAGIAAQLGIAQNTLKAQTRTLYRKLEVGTRAEALRAAYTMGLLAADPQPVVDGA